MRQVSGEQRSRRKRKGKRKDGKRKFFCGKRKIRFPAVAVFPCVCYNRTMEKLLTDVHTHTAFSPDGQNSIEKMLQKAKEKGMAYYGISEHFDYDYKVNGLRFAGFSEPVYTDPSVYFPRARKLQQAYRGSMEVLVGGEFGFTDNPAAIPLYAALLKTYRPDFVVNSVHTQGRYDFAETGAFLKDADWEDPSSHLTDWKGVSGHFRDKKEVYREYFSLVRKSLDAPYPYDVVGHLTYCTRYAPYADKRARWEDFPEELDGILRAIIERDKILEVNSSSYGAPSAFLPDADILRRYYFLGGRNVSFASDAHGVSRIGAQREKIVAALKEIGFAYVVVPRCGKRIEVEI